VHAYNNGDERAISNVKVIQKVSVQFKSEKGVHQFTMIRSVYGTIRENSGKIYDAFSFMTQYITE